MTIQTICSQVAFHFFPQFLGNPSINATVGDSHLHNTGQNNKTRVYLSAKSENGVQGKNLTVASQRFDFSCSLRRDR